MALAPNGCKYYDARLKLLEKQAQNLTNVANTVINNELEMYVNSSESTFAHSLLEPVITLVKTIVAVPISHQSCQ